MIDDITWNLYSRDELEIREESKGGLILGNKDQEHGEQENVTLKNITLIKDT